MSSHRVTPEGTDPIDSDNMTELNLEILRLRDLALGHESRAEMLTARVEELEGRYSKLRKDNHVLEGHIEGLEGHIEGLEEANQELHVELGRSPIIRVARAVARRLKLR